MSKLVNMQGAVPMRKYVREQIAALLRRLAFQVSHASRRADPDAVHDLRVSIRRLTQCLKTFREFLGRGNAKKIRRKLKGLMDLAAGVRNRDIALEFLRGARVPSDSVLVRTLFQQRREAERSLRQALRNWSRQHTFRKWRSELELQNPQ